MTGKLRSSVEHILLAGLGVLLGLVFLELGLRIFTPRSNLYYLWQPSLRKEFAADPEVFPGISGVARINVNSTGLRGDEYPANPDQFATIMAVGGSTTEELYLDQGETWPELVGAILESATGMPVWVGNAARSGLSSRHHVAELRYLIPQHPGLDCVIVLMGANDLGGALKRDGQPVVSVDWSAENLPQDLLGETFYRLPGAKPQTFLGHVSRFRLAQEALGVLHAFDVDPYLQQGDHGDQFQNWRNHRQSSTEWRSELPDLSAALDVYETNMVEMLRLADLYDIRLIFVTQPVVWRAGLPPEFDRLLWMGGVGDFQSVAGQPYYKPEPLAQGMALYNERMLEVCADFGAECIDAAREMNGNMDYYFDDMHFTEAGALRLAEIISRYLSEHPIGGQ